MKTVILGFDSFDPAIFESLAEKKLLPNLSKLRQGGGYARLEVSSPPQTEVSWTCIATGTDPGGHGIFDFVQRDAVSYAPYVSILPMRKTALGEQFVTPYTTRTFFEEAAEMGYPATALWWPAMYPARPNIPVNTLPGLGTPDIRGQLGVGVLFSTEDENLKKVVLAKLTASDPNHFVGALSGPQVRKRGENGVATLPIEVNVLNAQKADVTLGGQKIQLALGEWSEIIELKFKAGMLFNIHAITRLIATQLDGAVRIYSLPLQIHPLHSVQHYASSPAFAKNLWTKVGPYLTIGWPQDTTGLEDGCINDAQFLALCDLIFERRKQIFFHLLGEFKEGVLAAIFDDLDRVQHMFFHNRRDIAEAWYKKLDEFVGDVISRLSGKHRLLILSDHGFSDFKYKIHLNCWLMENGWLKLKNGLSQGGLADVDWNQTRAYAVGLNSLYLNVAGREGQGIVPAEKIEPLLEKIKNSLLNWKGSDGRVIVERARLKHEVYTGPFSRLGPDIVVGYAAGYRGSAETGVGKIPSLTLEPNTDHWGADHCMDADVVPGVIFANRDLSEFGALSFRDIPFLAIGKHLNLTHIKPPSQTGSQAGFNDIEERLKGLGYL